MHLFFIFFKAATIGFFTGILTAIPPGPATMESVKRTLSGNLRQGLIVSLGAVAADLFYIILINGGLSSILSGNKSTESLFWILSGVILAYIGFSHIKAHNDETQSALNFLNRNHLTSNVFLVGFVITVVNPMTPSLWLFMSGTAFKLWSDNGHLSYCTFIISLILGMIFWFFSLNYFAHRGIRILNQKNSNRTMHIMMWGIVLVGICFICFGTFEFIKSLLR